MPAPEGFHVDQNDVGALLSYFQEKGVAVRVLLLNGRWYAEYGPDEHDKGHGATTASQSGPSLLECARWLFRKHQSSKSELHRNAVSNVKAMEPALCSLCGKPMPKGEEMFNYHGSSGPCP
jgi:hypothetical protein